MNDFIPLTISRTEKDKPRKSGFELEFAGLNPYECALIVQKIYGGEIQKHNRFAFTCKGKFGKFDCVYDAKSLIEKKYQSFFKEFGIDLNLIDPDAIIDTIVEKGASLFVPCEITTPPLEFNDFNTLNDLVTYLKNAGAKGTTQNIHYAFGLHINLETPDLEAKTLLSYLQSYILLEPYIKEISTIDLTRRITAFIDPFPPAYIKQILTSSYNPTSTKKLMRDYLTLNPTRNRALDMTPIFGTIDENYTKANIQEPELLKPRPAFHYRLPNCSIGEKGWNIANEWNNFMLVEKLANDDNMRQNLLTAYERIQDEYFFGKKSKHLETIKSWAKELT